MAALSRPDDVRKGKEAASPMMCYALRLRPGEELKGALADFASDRGIRVRGVVKNDRYRYRITRVIR